MTRYSLSAFPILHGLVGLTLTATAYGQVQFGAMEELTGTFPEPDEVHLADLDADGDLDLLSGNSLDKQLVWFENDGSGQFGPKQVLEGGVSEVSEIHVADFDGDGVVDVACAMSGDLRVRWFRGLGSGTYSPAIDLGSTVDSITSFLVGDVDLDGDQDLVVAADTAGILWIENLDGGSFTAPNQIVSTTTRVRAAELGDLDGDGVPDLLYGQGTASTLFWRQGLGDGTFSPEQVTGSGLGTLRVMRLADFDDDGLLDVLLSDTNFGMAWLRGLGAGQLSAPIGLPAGPSFSIHVGDVDGDSDTDFYYANSSSTRVFLNQGGGQSWESETILLTPDCYSVALGDLDGDALQDFVVASQGFQLTWHASLGTGGGYSAPQQVLEIAQFLGSAELADLDSDNDLDVVFVAGFDGEVAWYENLGGGTFASQEVLAVDSVNFFVAIVATDIDDDGDQDLVWQSDSVRWMEQVSPGVWGLPQQLIGPGLTIDEFDLVDLDLDGDPELIVAPQSSSLPIEIYENLGGGDFGPAIVLNGTESSDGFSVGPLTSSGLPDLVVNGNGLEPVQWLRNNGSLDFDPAVLIGSSAFFIPTDIDLIDIDGDGFLDPVYCGFDGVRWIENLGNGLFSTNSISLSNLSFRLIQGMDLDTDGDGDLLLGRQQGAGLRWMENRGGALFSQLKNFTAPPGINRSVKTGDIDGDGDLDVMFAYLFQGRIGWFPGEGLDPVGSLYCGTAVSNSTGQPAIAFGSGSTLASDDDLVLHAYQLPLATPGIFLSSPNQGFVTQVPGSVGTLCLGSSIGRFNMPSQILVTSQAGSASLSLGTEQIATPTGTVAVQPGETWNFQMWYRDQDPTPTSNFTNAVSVQFQ